MTKKTAPLRIIISRTDAIGDVVLTLPMCEAIKAVYPACTIIFLCKAYTLPVVALCKSIDEIITLESIHTQGIKVLKDTNADTIIHVFPDKTIAKMAKSAGIQNRIGTTNRWYHWLYCNNRVALSRKNSALHEAQLNLKLLAGINIHKAYALSQIPELYNFSIKANNLYPKRIILHPKSNGSGREWHLDNFKALAELLVKNHYDVCITGSEKEGLFLNDWIQTLPTEVQNMCGKLTLSEFATFIAESHALVAAGTGPLHLSAAIGTLTIGIFPPIKPVFPQRWAPVGFKAHYVVHQKPNCIDCHKKPLTCVCINLVTPTNVMDMLISK